MKRTLLTALCLFLLLTPAAKASYDPLSGGTTRLTLDPSFASFLERHGVKLRAAAPAKLGGNTVTLPVSGGKMDPTIGKGEVISAGQVRFERGNRSLPFKRLTLKTKPSPIQAKVGGNQLKVVSGARVSSRREGFGTSFSAKQMKLTAKLATRLNKKLHLGRAFHEGQLLGSLTSKPKPLTVAVLAQGSATVTPDPALLAKMSALFVSLNPIAPAQLAPGPLLFLPIAPGGQIAPDASAGTLRLGGEVEALQLGAGQIFHKEYWLDLGAQSISAEVDVEPTPAFPGKLGRVVALGLSMAAATASSDPKSRTVSVSGAALALDASTAQAFNEAFAAGMPAFAAGEAFGTVSFVAVGQ